MMGIMMLVGIVVNNGILYVDGVHALMNEEGLGLEDALIESGKTRLPADSDYYVDYRYFHDSHVSGTGNPERK